VNAFPLRSVAFVLAQSLSGLGAAATSFAIDVWVFQHTGSYAIFAFLAFLAALPAVLLAPFSGALVDRLPRGALLVSCDIGSLSVVAAAAGLAYGDLFSVPVAGTSMVALSTIQTVRWPALSSAVTQITPKASLARVTGLEETAQATASVVAPILGAALFHLAGLMPIFLAHALLLSVCTGVVFCTGLPLSGGERTQNTLLKSVFSDPAFGLRWIAGKKQLLHLLIFMATLNIGCAIFVTSIAPIVLSFLAADSLAIVVSAGSIGLVLGGIAMTAMGGIRPFDRGVIVGAAGIAAGVLIFGFSGSVPFFALGTFLFFFMHPVVNTATQVRWRQETPLDVQGRVFAIRRMISSGLNPLAIALSIPLSAHVFGPALSVLRSQVPGVDGVWGPTQAGGLGFMVATLGFAMLSVVGLAAWRGFLGERAEASAGQALNEKAEELS
jgi:MFS transporter, DHA3 family, macrolide efflux protein